MDEDTKRKFDSLMSHRDHVWAEFGDKVRAEWRLSFGIWAALLAGAGTILSAESLKRPFWLPWVAGATVITLLVLHLRFLLWIQRTLEKARKTLREADCAMRDLAGLSKLNSQERSSGWRATSLQVQLGITLLLGGALLIAVMALEKG